MGDSVEDREVLYLWYEDNRELLRLVPQTDFYLFDLILLRFNLNETDRSGVLGVDRPLKRRGTALSTKSKSKPKPAYIVK